MLDKIILGTANFTQQYGILASGSLCKDEVKKILEVSNKEGLLTLDTAFGYGDIFSAYSSKILKDFIINTKFSLKGDLESLYEKLKELKSLYKIDVLMAHDPQHIKNAEHTRLRDFFECIKEENLVRRVGVSVYDKNEIELFSLLVCNPDVIQLPLNPINQVFNSKSFKQFILENKIEVHARSLFLQGVLLSDNFPEKLLPLKNEIKALREALASYPSILSGLLSWANQQEWVHKWVLGVSSVSNLDEICKAASEEMIKEPLNLIASNHTLIDPRTW
jgi:aryl-alcohol dehydrogenase-like predicted oxidoreductase